METRESIERAVESLRREHGEFSYDIPLPFGIWTRGNEGAPHTRLKRIVQAAQDACNKPIDQCRVLDLACLEGLFAIEFALAGAEVVGVEIREANVEKAKFCARALGLEKLSFVKDDVRSISRAALGEFDIIVCSGILYHLPADDVIRLIGSMYEMSTQLVIIDTHVSLQASNPVRKGSHEYWGKLFREHAEGSSQSQRAGQTWASWDNTTSFWFTRPSLVNLLLDQGFSSVHECLASPYAANEGGMQQGDRCTFLAVKGRPVALRAAPAINGLRLRWPEHTLTYSDTRSVLRNLGSRVRDRARRIALSRILHR